MEPDRPHRGDTLIEGVHYGFVPASRYRGNGWDRRLSMLIFALLLGPYCLWKARRWGRPDALIYSSPHPFGFVGVWLAARLLRARLIFEVRDLWPLSLVELAGMGERSFLVRVTGWIERLAYRRADRVVSLLPKARAHMESRGLPAGRFAWIPNGVALTVSESPTADELHPLARQVAKWRQQGRFVLVYAGALGVPNAIDTLLQAFVRLQVDAPDVHLILLGRGVQRDSLLAFARAKGLDKVEFHDQLDKASAMQVLQQASAGYISLRPQPLFRYGISPNKLWDYMAARLPVVFACKAANNPVEEHGCGLSADPADPDSIAAAILRLSRLDAAQRQAMGQAGFDAVRRFYQYDHLAARYLDLFSHRPRGGKEQ